MTATRIERLKAFFTDRPLFWAGYTTLAAVDQTLDAIRAAIDHKPLAAVHVVVSIAFAVLNGFFARWFFRRAARRRAYRDVVIQYALGVLEPDVQANVAAVIEEVKAEHFGQKVAS